ncbi:MAG: ABC transporter substrate-binding protein [Candidatus Aminicenantes bacterium]|nr:ABC transporter substrate-binding protein [Candidatus Aminicenantes bacterium]
MPAYRWVFALLFFVAAVILFGFLPESAVRFPQEPPRPGGILHVRDFSGMFKPDLDPAGGANVFVTEQIFDGLVRLDNDLIPSPALAKSWMRAEDGKSHVFYLREGVKFHDGKELSSQDVKFSFERLIRRETNSPFREYFLSKVVGAREFAEGKAADVAGFKTPEKNIFEVRWLNPNVSALTLLSMSFCKVLPRENVLAEGKNFFWRPVGTGPFKFDSWVRTPRLVEAGVSLIRNSAYFGEKKPYLDGLEISPFYTADQFVNKEIEVMPFLTERLARAGCQVIDGGLQNITFLLVSCSISPLDRPSVRKALTFGIDKDKLAQAVQGGAFNRRTTNNYIPSQWPGFYPLDGAYDFTPDKARMILAEQGFFSGKVFPKVNLFLPLPRNETHQNLAAALEDQLDKLGISLNLKYYQALPEAKDLRQPFLVLVDWAMDVPDPESIIRPLFQSAAAINLGNERYTSLRLDKLLDEAERERSGDRRNDLFRQMERVLVEDLPAIPLFANEQRIALQSYVHGLKVPPLGFNYLDAKEIWMDKKEPHQ